MNSNTPTVYRPAVAAAAIRAARSEAYQALLARRLDRLRRREALFKKRRTRLES